MIYAIDAATGATKWTFHAGAQIMSSLAVSGDGRVAVFGAGDGDVYPVRHLRALHADGGDAGGLTACERRSILDSRPETVLEYESLAPGGQVLAHASGPDGLAATGMTRAR